MIDSTFVVNHCFGNDTIHIVSTSSCLEIADTIATLFIALVNIVLLFYINRKETKLSVESEKKYRKFELAKSLILDSHSNDVYLFFHNIKTTVDALHTIDVDDYQSKGSVNQSVLALQSKFRSEYLQLFSVISDEIYDKLKGRTDVLVDSITRLLFSEEVDLKDKENFESLLLKPIQNCELDILRIIFTSSEYI